MKLAEALVLRSDLTKRLEQLKARLQRNAKVQDGDRPAEEPEVLLVTFEASARDLQSIIAKINLTNATASFDGKTFTDALAERDVLRLTEAMYRSLAQAATVTQTVNTRSEVRFKPTLSVADIQKRADALSAQLRRLDTRIQEQNWQVTLIE